MSKFTKTLYRHTLTELKNYWNQVHIGYQNYLSMAVHGFSQAEENSYRKAGDFFWIKINFRYITVFKFIFWPPSLEGHSGQHQSDISVKVKYSFWRHVHELKIKFLCISVSWWLQCVSYLYSCLPMICARSHPNFLTFTCVRYVPQNDSLQPLF